jgi:hypothetical protein
MKGLREGGVRVERAPEEALEDFVASRAPPPERMSKREREHARMLEPYRRAEDGLRSGSAKSKARQA